MFFHVLFFAISFHFQKILGTLTIIYYYCTDRPYTYFKGIVTRNILPFTYTKNSTWAPYEWAEIFLRKYLRKFAKKRVYAQSLTTQTLQSLRRQIWKSFESFSQILREKSGKSRVGHCVLFRSVRSVLFQERSVLFVLFSSFWQLIRPKRMFCSFLKNGNERKERKVHKRAQRTQRSFAMNVKEARMFCSFAKERRMLRSFFNIYI